MTYNRRGADSSGGDSGPGPALPGGPDPRDPQRPPGVPVPGKNFAPRPELVSVCPSRPGRLRQHRALLRPVDTRRERGFEQAKLHDRRRQPSRAQAQVIANILSKGSQSWPPTFPKISDLMREKDAEAIPAASHETRIGARIGRCQREERA